MYAVPSNILLAKSLDVPMPLIAEPVDGDVQLHPGVAEAKQMYDNNLMKRDGSVRILMFAPLRQFATFSSFCMRNQHPLLTVLRDCGSST